MNVGVVARYRYTLPRLQHRTKRLFGPYMATRDSSPCTGETQQPMDRSQYILEYWLGPSWKSASRWDPLAKENSDKWFGKSDQVDSYIQQEFGHDVELLETTYKTSWNKLYNTHASIDECVAYIILGDQMCRNMYRGTPDMYRADTLTLPLSKHLLGHEEILKTMSLPLIFFTLLPLMHSENLEDQLECVRIFENLLEEAEKQHEEAVSFLTQVVSYAKSHADVVAAYGRFPHRNAILGRSNTPAEEKGFSEGTIPSF